MAARTKLTPKVIIPTTDLPNAYMNKGFGRFLLRVGILRAEIRGMKGEQRKRLFCFKEFRHLFFLEVAPIYDWCNRVQKESRCSLFEKNRLKTE